MADPVGRSEVQRVACLDLEPGTTAATLARMPQWLEGEGSAGTLRACWYAVMGSLDRLFVWHSFADAVDFDAATLALATSADPFGASDCLKALSVNGFRKVSFAGDLPIQSDGPLFEVRDYVLKPDGLTNLLDLWQPVLPARLRLAPWVTAMYALTGPAPRMLHVYPWTTLEERARVRDGAMALGWPPAAAPRQILAQEATIYRAAAFSPLGGSAVEPRAAEVSA